ncbi:MAG: maltose alpha-D-glucosyltransferase [Actinomycetota bacterium]
MSEQLPVDPEWYRKAVFYEVMVRSFRDTNGDGYGDLRGMTEKLDYLTWLGVDAIWLPPFFASPLRDGGYDIADYTAINPLYGSMDDFDTFLAGAHERGMRVVIDLVINHTSDQHCWFQESRSNPTGPFGDFYVWSDTDSKFENVRIIFTDTETSNWAWDDLRQQFYWHRFFSHQPDLNFENPAVHEAVFDIVRFWLDKGVDGFRLDAIPYLYVSEGNTGESEPPTHAFIQSLRAMMDREFPGRMLVAEANQLPREVTHYFGSGESPECNMAFNFPVMPYIFYSLKSGDATGLASVLADLPEIPKGAAWGVFLRNHDELTLEMVNDDERQQMYEWYAPEPRMKVNVGIRRRLLPLLDGRRDKLDLSNAILLSLPGSPFLYYGDEIGMGDNIWLDDRDASRTPMQWDESPAAGFSNGDPASFYLPVIDSDDYGPQSVNVAAQETDANSVLWWTKNTLALRRSLPSLATGSTRLLSTGSPAVLAFVREPEGPGVPVVCVFNFSESDVSTTLPSAAPAGSHVVDARTGETVCEVDIDEELRLDLPAMSWHWLTVS